MRNIVKKIILLSVVALCACALSGCVSVSSINDLYALPQLSDAYIQLQDEINAVLKTGAEYSAPTSGSNRSAVQVTDLDGDGQNEAIVYFKVAEDDKPLKIYMFKQENGNYTKKIVISGEGTNIDSVAYTDMNGDGRSEVVVGWQISSDLKMLCIYSIKGNQSSLLTSTNYNAYTVHNLGTSNGASIIAIKLPSGTDNGEATMYSLVEDGEVVSSSAPISKDITSISRIRTNFLNDAAPAVYVEGLSAKGIVTDILTYRNGTFKNLTIDDATGVSSATFRSYSVYSTDIDGDNIIEVPQPDLLISQSETNSNYYTIKWYAYSSDGKKVVKLITYHNYSDGWFLAIPDSWIGRISVRRIDGASGERAVAFSRIGKEGSFDDFLIIYTLTGDNRMERARLTNRTIVLQSDSTIYAAEILVNQEAFDLPVNIEQIQAGFKIIYTEWATGETK